MHIKKTLECFGKLLRVVFFCSSRDREIKIQFKEFWIKHIQCTYFYHLGWFDLLHCMLIRKLEQLLADVAAIALDAYNVAAIVRMSKGHCSVGTEVPVPLFWSWFKVSVLFQKQTVPRFLEVLTHHYLYQTNNK